MCSPRLVFCPVGTYCPEGRGVHELPRGGVMPCQERDFWEMGPGACEGGRRPGNLERRAAGRECNCASPMANGKENRESSAITLAGLSFHRTLRRPCSAARVPLPSSPVDGHTRDPVFRIAWGKLCSPARSGRAFLSRSCGRMTSTDKKKVTQFVVALPGPHNETERATPCPVPRRPPRAVKMP
jgi:hypothetical protein